MSYSARISDNPQGTISSLEHVARSMDEQLDELKKETAETTKRLADLKAHVGKSFEYGEKLKTLLTRQEEVVVALDITKNQAASTATQESENAINNVIKIGIEINGTDWPLIRSSI